MHRKQVITQFSRGQRLLKLPDYPDVYQCPSPEEMVVHRKLVPILAQQTRARRSNQPRSDSHPRRWWCTGSRSS